MNIDRLQHLITVLEKVPPHHFDMVNWTCGSSACALGWAAQDREFKAQGLILLSNTVGHIPTYSDDLGFAAAQGFFGLTPQQAYHLFSINYYDQSAFSITPQDVINRIQELLDDHATAG